jgi:hypothetical protein
MRNRIALVFLLFFIWQLIGVTTWFELSRVSIRKEIKTRIKARITEKDLIHLYFSPDQLKNLTWIKKNEFRFNGQLYDVVHRSIQENGSVLLKCIDDIKEKVLFATLGETTANRLGTDEHPTPLFFCIKQLLSPLEPNADFEPIIPFMEENEKCNAINYISSYKNVFLEEESPPPCTFS